MQVKKCKYFASMEDMRYTYLIFLGQEYFVENFPIVIYGRLHGQFML